MRSSPPIAHELVKDRLHDTFLKHCVLDPRTGCWLFLRSRDRRGSGRIKVLGRVYTARRVVAWVYHGGFALDDPDVRVCGTCRAAACVHEEHLVIARRPSCARAA